MLKIVLLPQPDGPDQADEGALRHREADMVERMEGAGTASRTSC